MRLMKKLFTGSERKTSKVSEGVGGLFLNHSVGYEMGSRMTLYPVEGSSTGGVARSANSPRGSPATSRPHSLPTKLQIGRAHV